MPYFEKRLPLAAAGVVLAGAGFALLPSASSAVTVVNETFDAGSPTPLTFFRADLQTTTNPSLTVVSDTGAGGLGSGNALDVNTGSAFEPVVAPFTSRTLAVGEKIVLSFDFRFTTNHEGSGFSFGFLNSNGTAAANTAAVNSNPTTNDFGYYAQLGTPVAGGAGLSRLLREDATPGAEILHFNDSVPSGSVDPKSQQLTTVATGVRGANTNENRVTEFSIERLDATTARIVLSFTGADVSGPSSFSVTDTVPNASYFTFNELAFSNGAIANTDYRLDNITVDVVPEPGALGLVASGGLAALRRRRRGVQ